MMAEAATAATTFPRRTTRRRMTVAVLALLLLISAALASPASASASASALLGPFGMLCDSRLRNHHRNAGPSSSSPPQSPQPPGSSERLRRHRHWGGSIGRGASSSSSLSLRCGGSVSGSGSGSGDDSSSSTAPPKPKLNNAALIFIKPHADTPAVRRYVRSALLSKIPGVQITREYEIKAEEIDKKKMIDRHYGAIAKKATSLKGEEMDVPREKFKEFFGEDYSAVLRSKRALNALDACKTWKCDSSSLDESWRRAEAAGKVVKFGGGFYCGLLDPPSKTAGGSEGGRATTKGGGGALYVFNAFYMSMRSKYVTPGASVYCYEIQWPSSKLTWKKFCSKVLGPTDPSRAPRGSIRRTVLDEYRKLGLDERPTKGDNGVHGSASPLEGLVERMNWGGRKQWNEDELGAELLNSKRGITKETLKKWSDDPRVNLPEGGKGSLFDELEDTDVDECLERLMEIDSLAQ